MTRFQFALGIAVVACGIGLIVQSVVVVALAALLFLVVLGLGVAFPQLQFFGATMCRATTAHRTVALTFDDGPDVESTPALLNLLARTGTKATFFCIGERVAAHPELAARIVRDGHLIENHSYAHSNFTNFFTVSGLLQDLSRTQDAIRAATGVVPTRFRPPMGLSNPRVFRAARSLGLTVVGWSTRGLDTQLRNSQRVVDRIARRLDPGAIVLLHDGGVPADRLVATVAGLMEVAREHGYNFERLDRI